MLSNITEVFDKWKHGSIRQEVEPIQQVHRKVNLSCGKTLTNDPQIWFFINDLLSHQYDTLPPTYRMYIDVTDIKPCMWVNGFYVRVTCHVGANKIKKSILGGISDNSNQGNGTSVAGKCYDDDVIMMKSIMVLPMTMTHFRYIISSWEYCFRWWRQYFVMFMRQNSFVSTCNRCTCILISSRVQKSLCFSSVPVISTKNTKPLTFVFSSRMSSCMTPYLAPKKLRLFVVLGSKWAGNNIFTGLYKII